MWSGAPSLNRDLRAVGQGSCADIGGGNVKRRGTTASAKALRRDIQGPAKEASAGVKSRSAPEGRESREGLGCYSK